ncbi:MAG: DUF6325 family protein [Ilumatobacteraceae bacterium]|jgi:hypothetical protein
MTIGPVEYILIEFPGNQFTGEIVPALGDLIANETVRLIDVVFITKDALGNVLYDEYDAGESGDGFGFAALDGEAGLLGDDDILLAAAVLPPETSALLLVWEDLWAAPLAAAIRKANGHIVTGGRVPHEAVLEAIAESA